MKLNNIKPLSKRVGIIKPLKKEKTVRVKYLSSIEMILYSADLCYYSTMIIRNQIKKKNKYKILYAIEKEVHRMYKIISRDDWYSTEDILTKKELNENFKKFGIRKKDLIS
jgi:ribosome biogenesis protein Nip4